MSKWLAADIDAVVMILLSTWRHNRDVSRKGANTFTAQVNSKPSADTLQASSHSSAEGGVRNPSIKPFQALPGWTVPQMETQLVK